MFPAQIFELEDGLPTSNDLVIVTPSHMNAQSFEF